MKYQKKRFICGAAALLVSLSPAGFLHAEGPAYSLSQASWTIAAVISNPSRSATVDEPVMNNKYLLESVRANNLAKLAYADGDYDLSMKYSAEALRAARLSDEFVVQKLKVASANKKINEAADRLGWADRANAPRYFPKEFNNAKTFYNQALLARTAGEWDKALNNALHAIEALSNVVAPPSDKKTASAPQRSNAAPAPKTQAQPLAAVKAASAPAKDGDKAPLPAQYTVRPWDAFGDCFWNIAAKSWVYGNPYRWPVLYRANRAKLPDPNNPNVIEPGTVLDIPSIFGETRQGMWDSGQRYVPLR